MPTSWSTTSRTKYGPVANMQAEAPWLIAYLVLNYISPFTLNLLILCKWGVTQIFFQGWVCCPTVSFCRAWPVREPIWPKAHGLPGMACTPWPLWPPRDTLVGTLCLRSLPSQPKTHWACIKVHCLPLSRPSSFLLWTECMCPLKSHMLKPNPRVMVSAGGSLGGD